MGTADETEQELKQKELERRLLTTGLCQTIQELVSDYILLEDFFMSNNIRKALDQHQSEMAAQQVLYFLFINQILIKQLSKASVLFYISKKTAR